MNKKRKGGKRPPPVFQCKSYGCGWQGRAPDTTKNPRCPYCQRPLLGVPAFD